MNTIEQCIAILAHAGYSKREQRSHRRALERCDEATRMGSLDTYCEAYPAAAEAVLDAPEPSVDVLALVQQQAERIAWLEARVAELEREHVVYGVAASANRWPSAESVGWYADTNELVGD